MNSTLQLFKHLYSSIPPLFPDETKEAIKNRIDQLEQSSEITLSQLEDAMIEAGFEIWPWREAYKEFFLKIKSSLGEHFLLSRLPAELQSQYHTFKQPNKNFEDFNLGKNILLFAPEHRHVVSEALVEVYVDLKKYVAQQLATIERNNYFARVENFKYRLQEIKDILNYLKILAAEEQEHPLLTQEINAKIRSIEESLCLLGKELNYYEVYEAPEFFTERRQHLDKLKGIEVPLQIDFYSNAI